MIGTGALSGQLPTRRRAATRPSMPTRFISMLLMAIMLFSGVITPAAAHVLTASSGHSAEILDLHENAAPADASHKEAGKGDAPCHAIVHHHCGVAVAVDDLDPLDGFTANGELPFPDKSSALGSLAQAPPTEPPAS